MKTKTLIILIVGIIILAGGAYLAGQLFNKQPSSVFSQITGADGTTMMELDVEMIPAPELPTLPEIASGIFVERTDNIITINEFLSNALGDSPSIIVSIGEDGSMDTSTDGDTKQTEVMVTSTTKLLRDVTNMETAIENNATQIQQEVEEGSLDDLNSISVLTIWGRKNGDRIIADTIFYSSPNIGIE